ncbi:MAG: hypothetical protein HY611_00775, partial [Elusimicrobia bacterium]|nr:hypothetical protein [Elusimicrobiota bacterium]
MEEQLRKLNITFDKGRCLLVAALLSLSASEAFASVLGLGGYHSCAVLKNGGLKCWGNNTYGQLGLGDVANRGDTAGAMGGSLPTVLLG